MIATPAILRALPGMEVVEGLATEPRPEGAAPPAADA